jgi:molybdopterin-guanine dinucleotide biosynthesis protein B
MPENVLFSLQTVSPNIAEENLPGYRGGRVYCDNCGEGINFRREINAAGRILCIPCADADCYPQGRSGLQTQRRPPVLLIVGFKKVGKTRLLENLIKELSSRGYRVACIKHHHSDEPVVVDACGTDTWRFRKAGAKSVVLITPTHIASFQDTPAQPVLEQVLRNLTPTDLVLGEGFHAEPYPKIEVVSANGNTRLSRTDNNLIALVKTTEGGEAVPTFTPESIKPLADFIEANILPRSRGSI